MLKIKYFENSGGWTFAMDFIQELNITQKMDTPAMVAMQRIVDPICNQIKLIFNILPLHEFNFRFH